MAISAYVRDLRALVGSRRILLPAVSAHLFDASGRLLLVRQRDSGRWSTPGGAVEPDEVPEEAVIRETLEETGLSVRVAGIAGVYGGPEFVVRYPNGDETQYVIVAYRCTAAGGALANEDGDEIDGVGFFSREEARGLPLASWLGAVLDRVFATAHS